jgi:hypothetical protein
MRTVWILGALALLLVVGLAMFLAPLEPGVVALQLTFSPRAFAEVVHRWSPQDLARYRRHLLLDFALLAAYGSFGFLLVRRARWFEGGSTRTRAIAAGLLPGAAVCDAAENLLHGWLTEVPRFGVPAAYPIAGSLALIKWLLIIGFGVLVARAVLRHRM